MLHAAELKTFMSSLGTEENLNRDHLIEPVIMEDEAVEGEAGATDEAVQMGEVTVEAIDTTNKDIVIESVMMEGVTEDAPRV